MLKPNTLVRQTWRPAAIGLAMSAVAALTLTSCSSTNPTPNPLGETTRTTIYKEGVPGGVIVETTRIHATVVAVDTTNRAVTVSVPDGRQTVIGCGPEVANFNQIRVGDQVNAIIKSELVLALPGTDLPAVEASRSTAAVAPRGDKPGGMMSQTQEYTATVTDINQRSREVTLRLPDETTRTFPVRPDIDLSQRKVGQQVAVRVTIAVAISVEEPKAGSK